MGLVRKNSSLHVDFSVDVGSHGNALRTFSPIRTISNIFLKYFVRVACLGVYFKQFICIHI